MKRLLLIGCGLIALGSGMAFAAPESLLPPGFDRPAPTPTQRAAPTAPRPVVGPVETAPGAMPATPGAVTAPGGGLPATIEGPGGPITLPSNFPSIAEIEKMSASEIDELLGLKPKFDIPPAARRSLERVGVLSMSEGGLPSQSLTAQPAALVRAALKGTRHGLVSRWGHIMLRRALVSRLDAPNGMNPVEFAALRAQVLNTMGEAYPARALVQDVDSSNYDAALTAAAMDAYVATGDFTGICPVARLKGEIRKDGEWQMAQAICRAYSGDAKEAGRDLDRVLSRGAAPRIDVLLAKRYAGAARDGGQAVRIEWDGVSELTPWRYSLAVALGVEVPEGLRNSAGPWYDRAGAVSPALSLALRARSADRAVGEGILSSSAAIDLYSQIFTDAGVQGDPSTRAARLREAYVARTPGERLQALKDIWGSGDLHTSPDYGRLVLTAYAAARLNPSDDMEDDAAMLIASMLSAGLDRNALRWASVVPEGSTGWALLALAQPNRQGTVDGGAVERFMDQDASEGQRKSQFLVAGLAGLGRLEDGTTRSLSGSLSMNLTRQSPWSRMITKAAEANNPALVAMLAGLGMQGDNWNMMTARHLYLVVKSLNQVGLSAEARMIAAEAVARG